ncbi:unnamed protein product [Bursaphelenchus xylophilus]|uniref:(pine wood nematode) hypothetical protein n=1 Tax=Bursaphelenchus xylophilus TaxID=6326 RepID=A0A1I7RKX6_BURXY|nr:unnamed protein product [Bursaphelenchus xylophilus]CAG9083742.1 unnamed protein product [Bursaphelenchus xylophilus]
MIHPINIEADLLTANPRRPQLIELRAKPRITYSINGRRLRDGKPTTPNSPNALWANTFLRSFARRLATETEAIESDNTSLDSFVDIVDLKPEQRSRTSSTSSGSSADSVEDRPNPNLLTDRPQINDDDILQATIQMGPEAKIASKKILRRTSSKVPIHVVQQLVKPCCSAIKEGFKEFLRIDFANSPLLTEANNQMLTPRSVGSRVWVKENASPLPSKPALSFKIHSVAEENKKLRVKVDCNNPFDEGIKLEVMMHVHVAHLLHRIDRLLAEKTEPTLEIPSGLQTLEFEFEITDQIKAATQESGNFLILSFHGRLNR